MTLSVSHPIYLWWRFGHFIGLICWMAGLFYLPRLFVYHMESPKEMESIFQTMERRLYFCIILPASIVTWVCGAALVFIKESWLRGYFHLKLTALLGLLIFQWTLNRYRLLLMTERKSSVFFRFINEIPTILLIIIVYCAVFKPF